MKIFISWSGNTSKRLAETLRDWIHFVIQAVDPFVSSRDIDKGARWAIELPKRLEGTDFGIICLTPQNLQEPWLLFEAGALSKNVSKSRVWTILFKLSPAQIEEPLASFQHTIFKKSEVKALIESINKQLDSPLDGPTLEKAFEMSWAKLQTDVEKILTEDSSIETGPLRTDRDIMEEILMHTREISQSAYSYIVIDALFEGLGAILDTFNEKEKEFFGESTKKMSLVEALRFAKKMRNKQG